MKQLAVVAVSAAAVSAAAISALALAAPAATAATPSAGAASLAPPTHLHVVSATSSDILLQWDGSTDRNASYQVYLDDNPVPLTYGQAATRYDVGFNRVVGLIPGSTHTFFVRAYDGSRTADSGTVTGTFAPGDNTAPTTPADLHVVSQDPGGAKVAWDASADDSAVSYFVDGTPCGPLQVGASTQAVIPSVAADPVCGVLPGFSVTVTVRARDAWDNDSHSSNAVTVRF